MKSIKTEFYQHKIFPKLMEKSLKGQRVNEQRRCLLSQVSGNVLEIGFGTGLNAAYYPASIKRITAIDINSSMKKIFLKKNEGMGLEVEIHNMSAENMSFEDNSFDYVVSTFTLCSLPNPQKALMEISRVLKPEGRLLFLEHGISPNKMMSFVQNITNSLYNILACGCNVNRNMEEMISASGFQIEIIRKFYLNCFLSGYTYMGKALKSARD